MLRMTRTAILLLLPSALLGCDDKKNDSGGTECDAPVADAGPDVSTTLGTQVQLDASASVVCDRYSDEAVYTWTLATAPTGSAIDETALSANKSAAAVTPMFTPDETGTYTFELVVSDPVNDSALDVVAVRVESSDAAPIADCGGPYDGNVDESVQLDGSASRDPEGATLEYYWTLTGSPDCSAMSSDNLYNGGGASPTMVPDCDGIFTVSLVVSDGVHYSDEAVCYVDVASENRAPVADAGESKTLGACADNPLSLNGWGSYDSDDDDLTYQWTVVSVPSSSAATDDNFDDATDAEPRFSWDVEGSYVFQLQVHDGTEWSAPDLVTMTIASTSDNGSPIANAGDDQDVEIKTDCLSTSYVWTCDDCAEETFDLDATGSSDPDGDDISYFWSESTNTITFSNRYGVMTQGIFPAMPGQYGTDVTLSLTVSLDVADCETSSNDTITVNYTCTGENAH